MRFRMLNKLYANLFGYFWLPCAYCGQMMGGHEWHGYEPSGWNGSGICRDCSDTVRARLVRAGEDGLYCMDCERILPKSAFEPNAPTGTHQTGNPDDPNVLIIKGKVCKRCQARNKARYL